MNHIVWNRPSKDSSGSMPIGNGDIGLNVWVEEEGDLLFYIGKTDAWSENVRLLKLGRVRVKLLPSPFRKGLPFQQTLKLRQGEIDIRAGGVESEVILTVWVDANQPVIHLVAESKKVFDLQVSLEVWRTKERMLEGQEVHSAYGYDRGSPHPVVVYPDNIFDGDDGRIVWYHRNERSVWNETMKLQGMEGIIEKFSDPLLNRTFGGAIKGKNLVQENPTTLKSTKPGRRYNVSTHLFTKQTDTIAEWVKQLDQNITRSEAMDEGKIRAAHYAWWNEFWNRSWVRVSGAEDAEVVTCGYILQRFINACAGRGEFPIKFNGSLFTIDAREEGEQFDADYRRWGGLYWFQNTRLTYWPMLASGDFDMMQPFFRMYFNALPLAKERTQVYFGHEGAFFPETMCFWGAYPNSDYGWNRKGKHISHVANTYIRWYWQGALELTAMMLDYFAYTQDEVFLKSTLLSLVDAVIEFYDKHYQRDDKGKIRFAPAASLETWNEAVNPLPEIAGLQFVLSNLLSLPNEHVSKEQRTTWKRLRSELPPIPTKPVEGETILSPAEELIGPIKNAENPELYAIFPYRIYGVGKPDLKMAQFTFAKRRIKRNCSWYQDDTQMAFLGLAKEARKYVAGRLRKKHDGSRFPAFWGPNHDWIPDQDHGSNALMALQTMLLQAEGKDIILFPAWPKEWDVEFKLHAPMNTTVECVYLSGKITQLKVSPERRAKDIVKMEPQ